MAKDLNSINKVLNSNEITLYHNARMGKFKGKPDLNLCRSVCDFGRGIYLSPNYNRVNNISKSDDAIIYQVNINLDETTCYKFDNIYLFYMYCIVNRLTLYSRMPQKVRDFIDYINCFEIVVGDTIDGQGVFQSLANFVDGFTDLATLDYWCKIDVLGIQYCIKSQRVLDNLNFIPINNYIIDTNLYDLHEYDNLLIQSIDRNITFDKLIEKVVSIL